MVDITVPRSVISTADLPVLLPGADRIDTSILTMKHTDGSRSNFFLDDVVITHEDYSRLGRDVMERTLMVHDPRGGSLLIEVLDADV